jgi:hypothetical protein
MKIFELLHSLTPEEKKKLKKDFSTSSKTILMLWKEVFSITETEFQEKKAQIFRKIYGKPYTSATEKQLKNSLTELFQSVRALIAQLWLDGTDEVELNKCSNYLNTLGLRQANELFEKEWKFYLSQFESNNYHFGLSRLYFIKFNQTIRNPKMYHEAIICLKASYKYSQMAYLEDAANLSYTALNLNYLKEIYGIDEALSSQVFSDLKLEVENNFKNPVDKAIQLLEEKDTIVKWDIVQEIFTLLKDNQKHFRQGVKFKLGQSIFNYAIILIYEEEIEKAEIIFDFIEKNNLIQYAVANSTVFYFNYSSLLLKKGQIARAIEYQKIVMSSIEHIPIARKTQFLIREKYLQLLNKNFKNIYADLSELQTHVFKEDQMLYVRALIIIYLIETDDLASAYRECENSKRMQHFNSDLARDESEVIEIISKFLSIQLKEKIGEAKFQRLYKEILNTNLWMNSSNLLKIWLKQYISQLQSK